MSRFLFVVPPLAGHVHPTVAVAHALTARGHDVAWAGSAVFLRPLLPPGAQVYPTGLRLYRGQRDRGLTAIRSLWAGFVVPHAEATLPAVDEAVRRYRPDVLAVDQHALAGAVVAHRHGLPWATLAPGAMELTRPLRALPRVAAWVRDQQAPLRVAGMPDLRFSPYLVLAFTSAALLGADAADLPDQVALVGPAIGPRPPDPTFPWEFLRPGRRHVLVSMGTMSFDLAREFHRRVLTALDPLGDRLGAIVLAPPDALPDPPAHVLTIRQAPVPDLLPHLHAVLCHGGQNTVCEALAHGVPLVLAPMNRDQPVTTRQVVAAGAGVRVRFARDGADRLRAALLAVLDDPAYRTAAGRLRASLTAAGGAGAAADRLIGLTTLQRSGAPA
jgi:zeaxanthin glucosyltransferase